MCLIISYIIEMCVYQTLIIVTAVFANNLAYGRSLLSKILGVPFES